MDISILDTIVSNHTGIFIDTKEIVNISEESIPTGGNFAAKTIKVISDGLSSNYVDVSWPHPISALSMKFNTTTNNKGDTISLIMAPDIIIGVNSIAITNLPSNWVSQNYTSGDIVNYTDPSFGNRVYTCIQDTVNNENPLDKRYWKHGFKLEVNQLPTMIGYELKIDDGTNVDDLGRVLSINTNYVYTENAPLNTYNSNSLIKQNIYILKNFEFGNSWNINIGDSKIGGSYLPLDTFVRLIYNNTKASTESLLGSLEYLY